MSRRTVAGLVALGLIAGLVAFGASKPTGYVTWRPGPTLDVLGEFDGKQIVSISGHKTYRDDGQLRMVTVYESRPQDKLNLAEVLSGWIDPDIAVLPRSVVFPRKQTDKQVQQQSAAEMSSSQDAATAAALTAAGIGFKSEIGVRIGEITKGSAAGGELRPSDLLLAVDGKGAKTLDGFVTMIRAVEPGTPLTLTVERGETRKQVRLTTQADDDNPKQSRIGVSIDPQPEINATFPFKVSFSLSDSIGGPSAGMIFALTIYDLLTPGSLTGGKTIAGTGEISADGVVSPIGGIGQKIIGAQRDGARLFLVPEENCSDAAQAHYDKDKIRLVRIHTLSDAIKDVGAWSKDPDASLPRCTK